MIEANARAFAGLLESLHDMLDAIGTLPVIIYNGELAHAVDGARKVLADVSRRTK